MYVDQIEAIWIVLNLVAFIVTVLALREAHQDRRAVLAYNGKARELAAWGNVRREIFRAVIQLLLLFLVLPGLYSDRPVSLSFGVVVLMSVSSLLLVATVWDYFERRILTRLFKREPV